MPRAKRVFFDGAVYHVFNRIGRGGRVFASDDMASKFAELLREVTTRDGVTVFAWGALTIPCRLAVRAGAVQKDAAMADDEDKKASVSLFCADQNLI